MNKKEIFLLSLTIFCTIIAWIIADIYHIKKTQQVKLKNRDLPKKIDFFLDENIFKILKEKENYE